MGEADTMVSADLQNKLRASAARAKSGLTGPQGDRTTTADLL